MPLPVREARCMGWIPLQIRWELLTRRRALSRPLAPWATMCRARTGLIFRLILGLPILLQPSAVLERTPISIRLIWQLALRVWWDGLARARVSWLPALLFTPIGRA